MAEHKLPRMTRATQPSAQASPRTPVGRGDLLRLLVRVGASEQADLAALGELTRYRFQPEESEPGLAGVAVGQLGANAPNQSESGAEIADDAVVESVAEPEPVREPLYSATLSQVAGLSEEYWIKKL